MDSCSCGLSVTSCNGTVYQGTELLLFDPVPCDARIGGQHCKKRSDPTHGTQQLCPSGQTTLLCCRGQAMLHTLRTLWCCRTDVSLIMASKVLCNHTKSSEGIMLLQLPKYCFIKHNAIFGTDSCLTCPRSWGKVYLGLPKPGLCARAPCRPGV